MPRADNRLPISLAFFNGTLLVGSNQALPDDAEAALHRLGSPRVRDYLGPGVAHDVATTLKGLRRVSYPRRSPRERLNEDLYPRDEFRLR